MVKLYALARQISVHIAAEGLNDYLVKYFKNKYNLSPKIFKDTKRKRRFVPHQTDVDKFFRCLTANEVQNLFGKILMALCRKIARHYGLS